MTSMREPQLCVTVTGDTTEALRKNRDAAGDADLVELRLDTVERPDVAGALGDRRTPVILTCRARWEGGYFKGSEDERRRILESAVALGAEYVDVEAAASFAPDLIRMRSGRGIVASSHVFTEMPSDLTERYAALRTSGAEVAKLAVQVDTLTELARIFALADENRDEPGRGHVLIGMGNAGVSSRILAARLGSRWTYAGDGVAPGQFQASRLQRDFLFDRIRPDADIYAVVGNPILHSLSPVMHNAGFAALGINAVYVPLEARDAGDFVHAAQALGLRGASVTAPFKISLLDRIDEIDPLARRVGAINTVRIDDGRWLGTNTDVDGFLEPLRKRTDLKDARVTILGAGGSARAVAVALESQGAKVTISARRPREAAAIADLVKGTAGEFPPRRSSWDVLVNATPAGSHANPVNPIAGAALDGSIVFDLVYAPAETALIRDARAAGCRIIGGIEMLVAQAERQFELWTGQRPPSGLFGDRVRLEPDTTYVGAS
jgi:3-dehydroquinate dehydratase/shikimate dehydrogenase